MTQSSWHLGNLHAAEQALVWLIAFGPFVALFVVVYVVRRRQPGTDPESPDDDGG